MDNVQEHYFNAMKEETLNQDRMASSKEIAKEYGIDWVE